MTGKEKAFIAIKQRKKSAEEQYRRLLETLCENEKIDALFRIENSLKWDYVKARTEAEKNRIEEEIEENKKNLLSAIREIGYTENALKVPYSCKYCNDTGMSNGKECACVENARIEIALQENPILRPYPFGLEEINFSYYGENRKEKEILAESIKKAYDSDKKIFLFAGKAGTGKTYFAATFLKDILQTGKDVLALNSVMLNKLFLDYHCAPMQDKNRLWKTFEDADAILIDDLGTEQVLNNVTIPYLLELLTERTDKVTIITTNLSALDLEQRYGQRIVSRLLDKKLSYPLIFKGNDLRF